MLFEKLEWLTVYNRINYHKATLMFKCINNLAPEYLCSMYNSINENCLYDSRSVTSNNLQVPVQKVNILKELLYTLAQIYGILSHPTLKV
jgi:hypothetical protein